MRDNKNILRYAGLATQWMVMMGIRVWVGYKVDNYIGWRVPVFVILFPLLSLVVSLWQLIKEFNKKK